MKSTNFPIKKKKKKNSPWSPYWNKEHGSWGLEGAPFHHSIQGMDGIFFTWKVRKEGLLEDGDIINAKKKEVWKWVSQNGCVAKMANNTRIWKNIEGDEWREVEKLRKVFF